jgi:superoxide reductase
MRKYGSRDLPQACQDDLFCGVNTVEDIEAAGDLEKSHMPVIIAPDLIHRGQCTEITVQVGGLSQPPNEPGHCIEFIELYAGETYLARMDFTAQSTRPIMKTTVCLDHDHGPIRAFARCNLHGTWEAEMNMEVRS